VLPLGRNGYEILPLVVLIREEMDGKSEKVVVHLLVAALEVAFRRSATCLLPSIVHYLLATILAP